MALAFPLLAAAPPKEDPPNFEALGLSWTAGWIMLAIVLGMVTFFVAHREAVRRFVLRAEDPRAMGLFRITFGLAAFANVNELWEHFRYLFTSEGLFPTEVARDVRAKSQFLGFGSGDGEPWGFLGFDGFLQWAQGPNYSLLLIWDSPTFFWIYLTCFEIAMIMLIVGFQTRWVKWVAWFLFHGIILRNTVFWEGTENVYRTLFFYLCLSRCDAAYSVDNWLRVRRARREGRDVQPYELIAFWPRLLVMLQMVALYTTTGVVKNGPVWYQGDAFYYALNLDHFYRLPPQLISSWLGTTVFRVHSHMAHFWECFFGLVFLGLVLRWIRREKITPTPTERWLGNAGLVLFAAGWIALVWWLYPVHYREESGPLPMWAVQTLGVVIGVTLSVLFVLWWRKATTHPRTVTVLGRTAVLDVEWVSRWILGRRVWLGLGLTFHVHLIVLMQIGWFSPGCLSAYVAFFNGREIAQLLHRGARVAGRAIPLPAAWLEPPLPSAPFVAPAVHRDDWKLPDETLLASVGVGLLGAVRAATSRPDLWARLVELFDKKAPRVVLPDGFAAASQPVPYVWVLGDVALWAITVALLHRRGLAPRRGASWVFAAWVVAAIELHAADVLPMRWSALGVVALAVAASWGNATTDPAPLPARDPVSGRPRPPWAHGPLGRVLAMSLVAYHCAGVAAWLLPEKQSFSTFGPEARKVFENWLQTTQTTQGWAMFAPNPPKRNVFMKVVVTDADEKVWDLGTDVYACLQQGSTDEICAATYPIPWIWYSRTRKMNRRIVGSEGGKGVWYQKWHARHICREWQRKHDGALPLKVDIVKTGYGVPSPEEAWEKGPYDPKTRYRTSHDEKIEHTTWCAKEPTAQLSNEQRAALGFEPVDEKTIKTFQRNACTAWRSELMKRARARGETPADDDPRFDPCGLVAARAEKRRAEAEAARAEKPDERDDPRAEPAEGDDGVIADD